MLKQFIKTIVGIAVLGLFAWSLFFLFERAQSKPIVYATEKPFVTNIVRKAVATGAIVPRKEVAIKPRVSGVVEKLHVEAGQFVDKDALIAKITIIPDAVTLNSAEARVDSAKISFDSARRELARRKKLLKSSLIPEFEYNEFLLEYELKREELEGARTNLKLIREGASGKGGVVSNVIRSTVAGMVLDIPAREGESVIETNNFNEGTTIATIADMTDIVFLGQVDESEVGKIKEGMTLEISIGAIENRTFHGTLEFISPKGGENEGAIQFEIRAAMKPESDVLIRAGYSASADIVLERRDDVLAIQERLLQFEGDKIYVDVEQESQQFSKTEITVGLSDGINIEVLAGVDEDSRIKIPL